MTLSWVDAIPWAPGLNSFKISFLEIKTRIPMNRTYDSTKTLLWLKDNVTKRTQTKLQRILLRNRAVLALWVGLALLTSQTL